MFNTILVYLDGSTASEQVLPYAADIGQRCESRIVLLRVLLPAPSYYGAGADGIEVAETFRRSHVHDYLDDVGKPLRKNGLVVETVCIEGSPAPSIVAYAANNGMNLIAIATYTSRQYIGRMVFGSVADYVLRNTTLPVLTIKPR